MHAPISSWRASNWIQYLHRLVWVERNVSLSLLANVPGEHGVKPHLEPEFQIMFWWIEWRLRILPFAVDVRCVVTACWLCTWVCSSWLKRLSRCTWQITRVLNWAFEKSLCYCNEAIVDSRLSAAWLSYLSFKSHTVFIFKLEFSIAPDQGGNDAMQCPHFRCLGWNSACWTKMNMKQTNVLAFVVSSSAFRMILTPFYTRLIVFYWP